MTAASTARPPRFLLLKYLGPAAVTASALLAALSRIDFSGLAEAAAGLDFQPIAWATAALALGAALASLRLWLIARDLGYPMRLRDAVAALSLGQVAGSLFFQIVGQTIARGAFLSRRGVPLAGTLVMTGYERLTALAVSLTLAAAGAWFLFGQITLDIAAGGAEFVRLAVGLVLTFSACAIFVWGSDLAPILRRTDGSGTTGRVVRLLALSIAIQLSTMAAYICIARALAPGLAPRILPRPRPWRHACGGAAGQPCRVGNSRAQRDLCSGRHRAVERGLPRRRARRRFAQRWPWSQRWRSAPFWREERRHRP